MIKPTEALAKSETDALLMLVHANHLPLSQLACEFSRQHGEGNHTSPNGRKWAVSFDLSLCTYCGNLEPQEPACPAKLRRLQERLLDHARCPECGKIITDANHLGCLNESLSRAEDPPLLNP